MKDIPAFPSHYEIIEGSRLEETEHTLLKSHKGMTLRDYFAGQAIAGMCVNPTQFNTKNGESLSDSLSRQAYEVADIMIKERAKSN